jgi:hypothetical protein
MILSQFNPPLILRIYIPKKHPHVPAFFDFQVVVFQEVSQPKLYVHSLSLVSKITFYHNVPRQSVLLSNVTLHII